MVHYNTNPLSILADFEPESPEYQDIVAGLHHREIELLRCQPSFQKYVFDIKDAKKIDFQLLVILMDSRNEIDKRLSSCLWMMNT